MDDNSGDLPLSITLVAKWGKEQIELSNLSPTTNISQVKDTIREKTNVLPKRQKLIGLTTKSKAKITDGVTLSELKPKPNAVSERDGSIHITFNFILMGTPEEEIFVDPDDHDDLPKVVDDFDLDFNAGTDEWLAHIKTSENLQKFTESTNIYVMNEPRPGKPLMVLDLDHTLLDFCRRTVERSANGNSDGSVNSNSILSTNDTIERMKRPYMDEFLSRVYPFYDLVVWSQTSWRWLETKLIELGMLTSSRYKFCFVLDKTSMFPITSTLRNGESLKHSVKPLQIIWNKFSHWSPQNTVHLDDLSRNFALNPENGLKVTPFYRKKKSQKDIELVGLATFLQKLALEVQDFTTVDFRDWMDVVAGKKQIQPKKE